MQRILAAQLTHNESTHQCDLLLPGASLTLTALVTSTTKPTPTKPREPSHLQNTLVAWTTEDLSVVVLAAGVHFAALDRRRGAARAGAAVAYTYSAPPTYLCTIEGGST